MIISHKNKFIFIKTSKTAGTSVEIALSKFCGPDDIITPISKKDEEIRERMGYPGPQNFSVINNSYGFFNNLKRVFARNKQFYNHISANEVKDNVSTEIWDSYYKFCIERNPWDRVVSLYYHKYPAEPRPPVVDFVRSKEILELRERGRRLYTINGMVAVDKICKFESLSDDLDQVRVLLGLPEELDLPKAKGGFRKDKSSYREFFGETEKEIISQLFNDEIELFGYEF